MSSARYELRIEGHLPPDIGEDFDEFVVADAPPETVMFGEIVDDAHLQGVLARLQALGLRITSLRTVPN